MISTWRRMEANMPSPPRLERQARELAPVDRQLDEQAAVRAGVADRDQRVWVLRKHRRVTLCQSHAVVSIDWDAGFAHTSCGLRLRPDELCDIPMDGCMPCVFCVAATPLPSKALA